MQQTTMIPNSGIMSVPQIAAASYAVSSPGVTSVSSGEYVRNMSVRAGHTMYVFSGGWAENVTASGSKTIVNGSESVDYAAIIASSGAKITGARVWSFAYLSAKTAEIDYAWADNGGRVILTRHTSGAKLSATNGGMIKNNGQIIDAIISSGGIMNIVGSDYTAYATNVFISRGGVVSAGSSSYLSNVFCTGTLNLYSSTCTARDVYVYGGGNMNLYARADALRVTVKKFGALNGFTRRSEEYYDSCAVNELYHESTYVSSGVTAILNFVGYGGTASSTQMNGNATAVTSMTVSSGGVAAGVTLSGARMTVHGQASNVTVGSAGAVFVSSGGRVNNILLEATAQLEIAEGGGCGRIQIKSAGVLNGFLFRKDTTYQNADLVKDYECISVYDNRVLSSGCTAADTIIEEQGELTVASGAKLTGPLEINGRVKVEQGGIVDFNIANQNPGGNALVINWNYLYFNSLNDAITLTVDASDQETGEYALATNFYSKPEDFVISVVNTENIQLGTLRLGEAQTVSGISCQLHLLNGLLSLTVNNDAPAASVSAKSDINGNGVSDVLFQYTGGDHQLGFWLDGTDNWQGQGLSEPAEWDVIGAYDMSSDGKADVVMLGNVTVSGVKGAFVGYRKNGDMSTWENISYLTNAEGIDWQVEVGNLTGNEGKNSILWHAPDLGAVGVWTDGTDNWVSLGTGYDRNWEMIGAGDFDGDGADSILFSYANGAKYYALDLDRTATELGVSDSGWEVRAIGDFSGDGKDDIVAFNAATGLVAKWEDGNSGSWSSLGQLNAADWFIAGAGDYNGDGKDDLLVRQYSTGMLGYYADADLSQWNEMGRGVDMNWAVIA